VFSSDRLSDGLTKRAPGEIRAERDVETIIGKHERRKLSTLFRDMWRIDCEGALAVYRGEAPQHVVNPQVLTRPAFLQKLETYKAAFAAKGGKR
jgi:hypothetical protein